MVDVFICVPVLCIISLTAPLKLTSRSYGVVPPPRDSDEKQMLDRILRVDHAGEYGANRIYAGQMAVLGRTRTGPLIQVFCDVTKGANSLGCENTSRKLLISAGSWKEMLFCWSCCCTSVHHERSTPKCLNRTFNSMMLIIYLQDMTKSGLAFVLFTGIKLRPNCSMSKEMWILRLHQLTTADIDLICVMTLSCVLGKDT